jgi:hypothetical protein
MNKYKKLRLFNNGGISFIPLNDEDIKSTEELLYPNINNNLSVINLANSEDSDLANTLNLFPTKSFSPNVNMIENPKDNDFNSGVASMKIIKPKNDWLGKAYGAGYLGAGVNEMYSTPYYLHNLGRNIVGGKGLAGGIGIFGSAVGSVLSGARDLMGGMGRQNIQNFLTREGEDKYMKNMREKQYGYDTSRNQEAIGYSGYQEGGYIEGNGEQQVTPEQILMAYAQAKGLTEEQVKQFVGQLQSLPEQEQQQAFQEMMQELQGMQEEMQEGGMTNEQQLQQIQQQIAEALQQGVNPTDIVAQLVQMGVGEQEAMQLVQMVIDSMQQQPQQQPQPTMRKGGKFKKILLID